MGFYAKDEPAHPAADWVVTGTLSRARKPRSQDVIPPILTVGIGHRFYNPSLGRWLSRDPIGESQGLNLQTFTQNNTVLLIDAFGLATVPWNPGGVGFPSGPGWNISYPESPPQRPLLSSLTYFALYTTGIGRLFPDAVPRLSDWAWAGIDENIRNSSWHRRASDVARRNGRCCATNTLTLAGGSLSRQATPQIDSAASLIRTLDIGLSGGTVDITVGDTALSVSCDATTCQWAAKPSVMVRDKYTFKKFDESGLRLPDLSWDNNWLLRLFGLQNHGLDYSWEDGEARSFGGEFPCWQ